MITRIVTMTFSDENIPIFLSLFENHKSQIRGFKGCLDLKLIQNTSSPNEISTLSTWESEDRLNDYRNSELFGIVWPQTKRLFKGKPNATSFTILFD